MLDFDFLCGRQPSVAAQFSLNRDAKQAKVFFGDREIRVPTIHDRAQLAEFPQVDTLINFASQRSASEVVKQAIETGKFTNSITIAEGIPERETREIGDGLINRPYNNFLL